MDIFEKYYALSLRYLSYRPRSEKEIRDYLMRKKSSPEIIEHVISKLNDHKFLDDGEFARMWIESRNRSKPRSQRLLRLELKRKGIADEILESGIRNQELRGETDLELAKKIVSKKISKLRNMDKQDIYKKLGGMLARRGFSWDTIKQAVDETLGEEV